MIYTVYIYFFFIVEVHMLIIDVCVSLVATINDFFLCINCLESPFILTNCQLIGP